MTLAAALLLAVTGLPAQGGFPPGALGDDLQTPHYDRFLKAMREPSLWVLAQRDPRVEAYRFLCAEPRR